MSKKPTLPKFDLLSSQYPTTEPEVVKALIFGKGNKKTYITNTCTLRVSRAFNYSGAPIPYSDIMVTEIGTDKMRYALRVAEFAAWLRITYGAPNVAVAKKPKQSITDKEFKGKTGIIRFDVRGWADATGHFTLWDGSKCLYHKYFDKASLVELWTC